MNLSGKFLRISIVFIILITIGCFYFFKNLHFDYEFESFFPSGDPDLEYYQQFRKQFEYDNEFALIGVENKKGIFQKDFLVQLNQFNDSLKALPFIVRVVSPFTLKKTIVSPIGIIESPLLHINEQDLYQTDSTYIYQSPDLVESFFPKNAKSISVFIKTEDGISKEKSDSLLFKIEKLASSFQFDAVHIAGKLRAQHVYVEKIRSDFTFFFFSSVLLVVFFLFISFRSFWGIWLPLLIIILSMIWILGLMGAMEKGIDMMMVFMPTMLFIVGMSDVVHFLSKYREELRNKNTPDLAVKKTLRDVGFPTMLTLVTTAIGFLTLIYSNIKPIRDFGIYTSIGVFIAFILAFTIIPFLAPYLPITKEEELNDSFWDKRLHKLLLFTFKKRKVLLIGSVFIILFSIIGIQHIRINSMILQDIPKSDPFMQDVYFFENNYSGIRPFEMVLSAKDTNNTILSHENALKINELEIFLKEKYGVGYLISPLSAIKSLNRAFNGGYAENYRIPTDSTEYKELIGQLKKYRKKQELKLLLTSDFKQARITGKLKDVGSHRIKELNKELENYIKFSGLGNIFNYKLTGVAEVLDKSNDYLTGNMIQGIVFSILIVGLIIGLIHRSFKIILVSLIPNVFPLLIMAGLMPLLGIELNIATSIIFSIAFGIATDDTIHFLARLKLELASGKSLFYSIKRTYISTGKAVVVTSLILSGGFLTLVFSNFQSTFYFGLLISITLSIAIICDLLLLPPLLLWLHKKGKK